MADVISIAELESHHREADAWVSIESNVYDVTSFIDQHPGGPSLLVDVLGGDCTKQFTTFEGKGHEHSDSARDMLKSMKVGVLEGGDRKATLANDSEAVRRAKQVIDFSKPLTFQVGKLGKHYQDWVHTPIHTDKPLILLGSWMESFTNVSWYVPLVFWIPAVLYMLYWVAFRSHFTVYQWLPLYAVSVCAWPFLEYFLHGWVYHAKTESYWMNTLHFLAHGIHHLTPMDKTRLVAPPPLAITIASPILSVAYMLSPSYAFMWTLMAGLFSGYLVYDEIHYWLHHANPRWAWLRKLKTHHMEHHYQVPDWNFGVSNTFIDRAVGTLHIKDSK